LALQTNDQKPITVQNVRVSALKMHAAVYLQPETWLNRNRYLIVAAFRGNFNCNTKRSTVLTSFTNSEFVGLSNSSSNEEKHK